MAIINENYLLLKSSYIFSEIAQRVEKYEKENPEARVIRMGIGDVTLPLPRAVVEGFKEAVEEMGRRIASWATGLNRATISS